MSQTPRDSQERGHHGSPRAAAAVDVETWSDVRSFVLKRGSDVFIKETVQFATEEAEREREAFRALTAYLEGHPNDVLSLLDRPPSAPKCDPA